MAGAAGRSCPLAYRYRPEDLGAPVAFSTSTLYVVGGLYGNPYALDAVLARAASETPRPEIVFNGDFHYLDADREVFAAIADGVLAHRATQGNVEYALTPDGTEVGCGCDYPDYIRESVVQNSNEVVARLRGTAAEWPEHVSELAALPRYLTAVVGNRRVGVIHGDPENLAGWKLALEAVEPADPDARRRTGFGDTPTSSAQVVEWCRRAGVDVVCCTHTGLPYAQDHRRGRTTRYLVANNGCAGLPNFRDTGSGVFTRLCADPTPPADSLYGTELPGLRFDALPIDYDRDRWMALFRRVWPQGSAGHRGYWARVSGGTWLPRAQADRLDPVHS